MHFLGFVATSFHEHMGRTDKRKVRMFAAKTEIVLVLSGYTHQAPVSSS